MNPPGITSSSSSSNQLQYSRTNAGGEQEAIVDKLHGALAVLRKERDELHRAKEMAVERLRLAKEERINAEKNLSLLEERYQSIASADAENTRKADIEKLQEQAQRLGREVKFHHAELVGKREKMNKLKTEILQQESMRDNHLRAAKEAVRVRRQKVAHRQAQHTNNSLVNTSTTNGVASSLEDQMNHILQQHGDSIEFFMTKIQRLLEKKCSEYDEECTALNYDNILLRKRIVGYEAYLDATKEESLQ